MNEAKPGYPLTVEQALALNKGQQKAVALVVDHLCGEENFFSCSREEMEGIVSDSLDLLCEGGGGCVPNDGYREGLEGNIRKKFVSVYWAATELAGKELGTDYGTFCILCDVSTDDATYVAVISYRKPHCYYQEYCKAWRFNFSSMRDLTDSVLQVKAKIVETYRELNK